MKARDKILSIIYNNSGVLITDLIKASKVSVRTGMQIISLLLKEKIIKEEVLRRGKKTITRRFYPNFNTELGKATFSLVELAKTRQFYEKHRSLLGPFTQFSENVPADIILIFGSFARGGETKGSDLDLLLLSNRVDKRLKDIISKEGEIAFSTVDYPPSVKIESFSDFKKSLEEALHATILRDHIIIKGAAEFIGLLS